MYGGLELVSQQTDHLKVLPPYCLNLTVLKLCEHEGARKLFTQTLKKTMDLKL